MSRLLSWLAALAILALIGVALLGTPGGRSSAQPQRLPDGSRLALAKVTFGRDHWRVRATWWQELFLNPFLPDARRYRSVTMVPGHQSGFADTLAFWTKRTLASPEEQRFGLSWQARGTVFDEQGNEAETAVGVGSVRDLSRSPGLEAWEALAFPRRGKRVGLRLHRRTPEGDWRPAAEFVTPNPDPGPHPTWTPQPLPITRRQGNVSFTMTGLKTGVSRNGLPNPPSPVEAWTEATFQVTQKGKPTRAWEPVDSFVSDATGNAWKPLLCLHERRGGQSRLFFRGALWKGEPAWKLRVEFAPGGDLAPNAIWRVRGVPAPSPGATFARRRRPHGRV